jgi:pimeloyl-ACP methyl ester carboxylesterase
MLTDPVQFGGRPEDSFDVVVPDLPGYGFSDKPSKTGTLFRVNDLWARLMKDRLGYKRFGAHGGDWGSTITEQLARSHADCVVAIHLTDVPFGHIFRSPTIPLRLRRNTLRTMRSGCKGKELTPRSNPPNRRAWLTD